MKERQSLTRVVSGRYKKARKREKNRILNEFIHSTGYNRKYAAYILRMHGKRIRVRDGRIVEAELKIRNERKRARVYDERVSEALRKIWKMMNYI